MRYGNIYEALDGLKPGDSMTVHIPEDPKRKTASQRRLRMAIRDRYLKRGQKPKFRFRHLGDGQHRITRLGVQSEA